MTPEEQNLQKQIDDLKFKLDMVIKSDRYLFQRNVELIRGVDFKHGKDGRIGLFGKTPAVQHTTTGSQSMSGTAGSTVGDASLFYGGGVTGFTIGDIVTTLKEYGLLPN